MKISRSDVIWNYSATFLKVAASIILLPLILRIMSTETVGIWSIFMTISAFAGLLDFGFNPTFARNVTYVFSGVRSLKASGIERVETDATLIDYGLLKGLISAMKWFYFRGALSLFLLLSTIGTYYIHTLLKNYTGNRQEVYIAWAIFCIINTYNLYTLYYDSLLQGKGLIKRSKQIIIIGNLVYLVIASCLILGEFGLIAISSAQAASVIIIRWFSHRTFFNSEMKENLKMGGEYSQKEVLKVVYPNAIKVGLISVAGFLVTRSSVLIGSFFLPLNEIASYGITIQLISVISILAGIYTSTYQPKIAQLMVSEEKERIRELYLRGQIILLITFIICGFVLVFLGKWAMDIINSNTQFISTGLMIFAVILSLEQTNLMIAGGILLAKNEVPFLKAALISGIANLLGLLLSFFIFGGSLLLMLLIPFLIDISYQAWKWPIEVIKELNISFKDFLGAFSNFKDFLINRH
jgi:O-antigen/teichoic acid export membrane protein